MRSEKAKTAALFQLFTHNNQCKAMHEASSLRLSLCPVVQPTLGELGLLEGLDFLLACTLKCFFRLTLCFLLFLFIFCPVRFLFSAVLASFCTFKLHQLLL